MKLFVWIVKHTDFFWKIAFRLVGRDYQRNGDIVTINHGRIPDIELQPGKVVELADGTLELDDGGNVIQVTNLAI